MVAKKYSDTETVKLLIDAGSNVNAQNSNGWSALMIANKYSDIETVKMLLSAGSNVDLQNNNGETTIMILLSRPMCNKHERIKIIKLLLESNCNLNLQNINGMTALMYAITVGKIETDIQLFTHMIIKSQKSITLKNTYGKTAYDYYMERNLDILDDYSLNILKGAIYVNNVKSAMN